MNLPHSLINPALSLTQDTLTKAFEPATEQLNLRGVFGEGFDFVGAVNWLKIEAQQNFPNFPNVEIIPSNQINNAQGAYAAENNTIYLATELVEQNQSHPNVISRVIMDCLIKLPMPSNGFSIIRRNITLPQLIYPWAVAFLVRNQI